VLTSNDTLSGQADEVIELPDHSYLGFSCYWQLYPDRLFPMMCIIDKYGNDVGNQIFNTDTLFNQCYDSYFYNFASVIAESYFLCMMPHNYELFEPSRCGEVICHLNGSIIKTKEHIKNIYPYSMEKTLADKYIQASSTYEFDSIYEDIYLYKINSLLQYDTIYPGNYTYDSLCGNLPILPGFITLDNCEVITSMEEIPTPEEYYASIQQIPVKAYPNPVNGSEITFEFENTEYLSGSPPSVPPKWGEVPFALHLQFVWGKGA